MMHLQQYSYSRLAQRRLCNAAAVPKPALPTWQMPSALRHRPTPAHSRRCHTQATDSDVKQPESGNVAEAFRLAGIHAESFDRASRFCPRLLSFPLDRVLGTLDFLQQELLLTPDDISKMLVRHPELFSYSLEHRMQPVTEFLREDLRLGHAELREVVTRWPVVFSYNVRAHLKPQLAYLVSLGVSHESLPDLVRARPLVLGEGIEAVISFLKRRGVPRTQMYRLLASCPLDYQIHFRSHLAARETDATSGN